MLSESEFNELEELYRFRNIVVHRFIISGVAYDQVGPKLDQYEAIYRRVYALLEAIEQPSPPLSADEVAAVRARIARKLATAEGTVRARR